jgi:hypothetical protein
MKGTAVMAIDERQGQPSINDRSTLRLPVWMGYTQPLGNFNI